MKLGIKNLEILPLATEKKKYWDCFVVALIISAICTFITYPGIMYSDSYERIRMAEDIALRTQNPISMYISFFPQLFMALGYFIAHNHWLYTFAQSLVFLLIILVVLKKHCGKYSWMVFALLWMTSPLIFGYSVFWEMNVISLAGILMILLLEGIVPKGQAQTAIYDLAYAFSVSIVVGYRLNAASAIAGILLWNIARDIIKKEKIKRTLFKIFAAVIGVLVVMLSPNFFNIAKGSSSNGYVGFLWETSTMLCEVKNPEKYDTFLDEVLGDGVTKQIMQVESPYSGMYAFAGQIDYWGLEDKSDIIYKKYFELAFKEPTTYFKVKTKIIGSVLGSGGPLFFAEYFYNKAELMGHYKFSDTLVRQEFVQNVNTYMNKSTLLRTPWLMYLAAISALLLCALVCKKIKESALWLFCVSLFFEAGLFVTTQTFEFRYFFPSAILSLLCITICASDIGQTVYAFASTQVKKRLKRTEEPNK